MVIPDEIKTALMMFAWGCFWVTCVLIVAVLGAFVWFAFVHYVYFPWKDRYNGCR